MSMSINQYILGKITPKWVYTLKDKIRSWKIKHYKHRKVKQSMLIEDTDYWLEFKVNIADKSNPQSIGPFNIIIPAKGVHFAKRKLKSHIINVIDIEVTKFERIDD